MELTKGQQDGLEIACRRYKEKAQYTVIAGYAGTGKTTLVHFIIQELGLNEKYSVASWRKTFAYHYYEKYKDISYLMWLFNQHSVNIAFKFIDVDENMNLRFREGVCL